MAIKIDNLIPHRNPMIFIDDLISYDKDNALAEKIFCEDDYPVSNGIVAESALIECVAQTVAAKQGREVLELGKKPENGLLVGVDEFEIHKPAVTGSRITINAKLSMCFGQFRIIDGTVSQNGEVIAEGGLKFYLPGEDEF